MTKTLQIIFILILGLILLFWLGEFFLGIPVEMSDNAVIEDAVDDYSSIESESTKLRLMTLLYAIPAILLLVSTIFSMVKRNEKWFYCTFLLALTLFQIKPIMILINGNAQSHPLFQSLLFLFILLFTIGQIFSINRIIKMKKYLFILVIIITNSYVSFGQNVASIDTAKIRNEYIKWISEQKEFTNENDLISNNELVIYFYEIYTNLFDQFKMLRVSNKNFSHTIQLNILYDMKAEMVVKESTYSSMIDFNKLLSKSNKTLNKLDQSILYLLINYRQIGILNPFFFNQKLSKKSYLFSEHKNYNSIYSNKDAEKIYSYLTITKQLSNKANQVEIATFNYSNAKPTYKVFRFKTKKNDLIEWSENKVMVEIK